MPLKLKIPARINILGSSSDANEGDFATISAAVDLFAHATIESSDGISIEHLENHSSPWVLYVNSTISIHNYIMITCWLN